MECHLIHLTSESKRIGSGRRIVFVAGTRGRKWVTIFYPYNLIKERMHVSDFDKCIVRECTRPERNRVLKTMRRISKEYDDLDLRYSKNTVKQIIKESKSA
jgi:hypothetical protein